MNARRVTPQEREKMWELYKKLGSYTKVAAKLNRSPATVSRHVHEYEAAVNTAIVIMKAQEQFAAYDKNCGARIK